MLADGPRVGRVLDRISLLQRRAAGTGTVAQLIAANVDTMFVVTSCNADFNEARLERYLVLAHSAGITPVVVLTKADMAEAAPYVARAVERRFSIEFERRDADGGPRSVLVPREARIWQSILAPIYLQLFEGRERRFEGPVRAGQTLRFEGGQITVAPELLLWAYLQAVRDPFVELFLAGGALLLAGGGCSLASALSSLRRRPPRR